MKKIKTKKELQQWIAKIKKENNPKLDSQFEQAHEVVFKKVDCLQCANCCKTTSPMFFEKDIERLAKHLQMKIGDFVQKYLLLDSDGIYALKNTPCPFLLPDNYCSVYEARPKACREFPHTNHRKMHTHLHLIAENYFICPAVESIVEGWGRVNL